jgi:hypothetical protein
MVLRGTKFLVVECLKKHSRRRWDMAWSSFRDMLLLSLVALTFPVVSVAQESTAPQSAETPSQQVVTMQMVSQEDGAPRLGFGNCQWLKPHESSQEELHQEPEYRSEEPVYYAARYGDSMDPVHSFVLDESKGTG